jgi:hypothetical protein
MAAPLYTIGRCEILEYVKTKRFSDLFMLELTSGPIKWSQDLNNVFIKNGLEYCSTSVDKFGIVLFVTEKDYKYIKDPVPKCGLFNCFKNKLFHKKSSIHKECVLFLELRALKNLHCYYNDDIFLQEYKCIFFSSAQINIPSFSELIHFNAFLNSL